MSFDEDAQSPTSTPGGRSRGPLTGDMVNVPVRRAGCRPATAPVRRLPALAADHLTRC